MDRGRPAGDRLLFDGRRQPLGRQTRDRRRLTCGIGPRSRRLPARLRPRSRYPRRSWAWCAARTARTPDCGRSPPGTTSRNRRSSTAPSSSWAATATRGWLRSNSSRPRSCSHSSSSPKPPNSTTRPRAHWPESSVEEDALFMQGDCYFFLDKYPDASDAYAELLKKYDNSRHLDKVVLRQFRIAQYWLELQSFKPRQTLNPNVLGPHAPDLGHARQRAEGLRIGAAVRSDRPAGRRQRAGHRQRAFCPRPLRRRRLLLQPAALGVPQERAPDQRLPAGPAGQAPQVRRADVRQHVAGRGRRADRPDALAVPRGAGQGAASA